MVLGKGDRIRFWEDPWMKNEALYDQNNSQIIEECKRRFGLMVCDYWKDNKWVRLDDLHSGFSSLQKELLSFSPNKSHDDVFLWKSDPKGEFMVASSYKNTFSQTSNPIWSKFWNNILIPKVKIFFWLPSHNSTLTLDNLIRRGLKFPNRCELCQKEGESVDHLFFHCSFTWDIWCKMWEKWKIN